MKKKIVMIIALCLTMLLVGCSDKNETSDANKQSENKNYYENKNYLIHISTETIGVNVHISYLYDKETKVMYMIVYSYKEGLSITPLYNADGTLRLYEKDEAKEK